MKEEENKINSNCFKEILIISWFSVGKKPKHLHIFFERLKHKKICLFKEVQAFSVVKQGVHEPKIYEETEPHFLLQV